MSKKLNNTLVDLARIVMLNLTDDSKKINYHLTKEQACEFVSKMCQEIKQASNSAFTTSLVSAYNALIATGDLDAKYVPKLLIRLGVTSNVGASSGIEICKAIQSFVLEAINLYSPFFKSIGVEFTYELIKTVLATSSKVAISLIDLVRYLVAQDILEMSMVVSTMQTTCQLDASSSGAQMLSVAARAINLAKIVNVVPTYNADGEPEYQDIYTKVTEIISADLAKSHFDQKEIEFLTRDIIKHNIVIPAFYGSSLTLEFITNLELREHLVKLLKDPKGILAPFMALQLAVQKFIDLSKRQRNILTDYSKFTYKNQANNVTYFTPHGTCVSLKANDKTSVQSSLVTYDLSLLNIDNIFYNFYTYAPRQLNSTVDYLANIIHSMDAYVASDIIRASMYTKAEVAFIKEILSRDSIARVCNSMTRDKALSFKRTLASFVTVDMYNYNDSFDYSKLNAYDIITYIVNWVYEAMVHPTGTFDINKIEYDLYDYFGVSFGTSLFDLECVKKYARFAYYLVAYTKSKVLSIDVLSCIDLNVLFWASAYGVINDTSLPSELSKVILYTSPKIKNIFVQASSLIDFLPPSEFSIVTIHDCFAVPFKYRQWAKDFYNNILVTIANSNLLYWILRQCFPMVDGESFDKIYKEYITSGNHFTKMSIKDIDSIFDSEYSLR